MIECKTGTLLVIGGEEIELNYFVTEDGVPKKLDTPDEIVMRYENTDLSILSKTLSGPGIAIISDGAGHFRVTISEAESRLLRDVEDINQIADITKSSKTNKILFRNVFTKVSDPLDP